MSRGLLISLVALCAWAPTAGADVPVLGDPQSVGQAGGPPLVSMGPQGDARVAWATRDGIWAALRSGPAVPFGPVQQVAPAGSWEVAVARNATGAAALVFATAQNGSDPRIAFAAPGAAFANPEPVPVVERAPVKPGNENIDSSARNLGGFQGALAVDGTAAVVYKDADHRAELNRAIVVVRSPLGGWGQPQVLGSDVVNVSVAASGTRIVAMWTEHEPGAERNAPRRVWVSELGLDGRFGAPRALSPADRDADNNFGGLGLVSSFSGNLLIHYNSGQPGHPIPMGVGVVERPLAGDWGQPTALAAGMRPTAAVGDRGDAVVVWSSGVGLGMSYRPPGSSWGAPENVELPPGSVEAAPVAIDALGTVIALRRLDKRFVAVLRRADGKPGELVDVVAPGTVANWPAVAIDPFGNGVIAWTTADSSGPKQVFVRPYSARPPAIREPVLREYDLSFTLSEPARLGVTISRVTRKASASRAVTFRAAGRARANRLRLPSAARRMLARGGRFRVTVRARDGGPRVGRRTLTIRR